MGRDRRTLLDILIGEKLITEKNLRALQEEAKISGRHIEQVLSAKGLIDEERFAMAKAEAAGVPYMRLSEREIDRNIVHMISEGFAKAHNVIPVEFKENTLNVAMVMPSDLAAINEMKLITGCNIQPVITTPKEMFQALDKYFKVEEVSKQALIDMRMERLRTEEKPEEQKVEVLEGLPSVKLVDDIIVGAVSRRASDVHFEPQDPEMIVRYRVDGVLYDIMTIPKHIENTLISRLKIMANMNITETRRPQDGHLTLKRNNRTYDFRVSTLRTINGEKIVLRVLDRDAMLIGLGKLGFTPGDEKVFRSFISRPFGMILVTGPTGSGKTTSLYAVMSQLEIRKANIITIENPVEYKMPGINQVQVDPAMGMTFATGLRTMLRQDPDVILVGEIRDKETAEIAIHAALTGHLVFSTLHTNDAPSAVTRLIDMGVEPFLISATVIGCIAQRLCRTICPECRTEYRPAKEELDVIGEFTAGAQTEKLMLNKGRGCDFCFNTGFKGREAIFEVMKISDTIRRLIVSRAPAEKIAVAAVKEGMRPLRQNGIQKVIDGISTLEEIRRVVYVEGDSRGNAD